MRENAIRSAVNSGQALLGTWLNMARTPAVLPLLKATGLDFVRVDMEHAPRDLETVADLALLSRALDFPLVVRPPASTAEWVARLLDAGVWNLHCPGVESPAQAAELAAAARYAPLGSRGMAGRGPHTDFEMGGSQAERMRFTNEQVFVTVMLESRQAFLHLDEIAATPGIDALTLGPADLAQDLGVFGTPAAAAVLEEHRQIMFKAAKANGKACVMAVSSVEEAKKLRAEGALLLAYSSEIDVLQAAYGKAAADWRT